VLFDSLVHEQVGAAAIEIWTMDDGYFFDNIVVSNNAEEAAQVRDKTWSPKKVLEVRYSSYLPGLQTSARALLPADRNNLVGDSATHGLTEAAARGSGFLS
jgi:hypothetical protein